MLDPFDHLDPFTANLLRSTQPGQQGAGARPQPLTLEEEDSLLGRISGKVLGGIGYAGSVLEKTFGGRALRGALGGKPRELLSIIPGSDLLGITDESERVSGKELLGLGHDDDWLSTIGGIGAEIALDPATYLTLGGSALSKGGQVAKKIGALPRTTSLRATGNLRSVLQASPTLQGAAEAAAGGAGKLAPLLEQPLGGVAGLGLPFRDPSILLGTGQSGANFMSGLGAAGRGIDATVRAVPGVGHAWDVAGKGIDAAGRYANAWFDPAVMGAVTRQGQEVARDASGKVRPLVVGAKDRAAGYAQELEAAGRGGTGSELRALGEGVLHGPAHPAEMGVADRMLGDYEKELQALQGLGIDVGPLRDEFAQFMSRQRTPLAKPTSGYGRPTQPLVARDPRIEGREDILKNFPGGTEGVNKLVLDPDVYSGTSLQAADIIRNRHLGRPNDIEQSTHLADWVRSLDPQYKASIGTPNELRYFGNHPLQDYLTYFERSSRLRGAAEAAHKLIGRTAIDTAGPVAGVVPPNARRLLDVLKEAGLDYQVINNPVGGATEFARRAGLSSPDLSRFMVPAETSADLTRYLKTFTAPDSVGPLLGAFDYLTNLTKTHQTATWLAFHVRNLIGGMFQNLVKGGFEPGLNPVSGFLKPIMDTTRLMRGEVLPDANKIASLSHLKPEEATRALAREMFAHGVAGHPGVAGREITGAGGVASHQAPTLHDVLKQVPGQEPKTLTGALAPLATRDPQAWSPLNVTGVGANQDLFAPVAAGRQVGDIVEGTNRGSLYIALRRQGHTPEEAARQVLEAHFDYSRAASTDVEAKLLKRVIPFYRFTRENIPFQVKQLMERPGGLVGMEARLAQGLRQEGGFLPDYLGNGLAIPLGGEDESGTKRFLTRLDLPPEQAFEMLRGGPGALPKTLMSALGNVNPLIKAPLEYATGKQFFTGRDLEDLYTMTGSTGVDQLLMNSPASRALTTARTLADERKWADPYAIPTNLLTGLKVSDVDIEKQRNIAAREFLTESLRGNEGVGKFQSLYLKPGMENTLTPEEAMLMRLNATLEKKAQEAGKKKIRVGG